MQIDVIIPTYNRAEVLQRAIHSVLNQSYKNFHLYVVDDGSTDDTQKILEPFKTITVLTQKNSGVSAARNYGVQHSKSPWISFLDSDDEWLPHKLQAQVDYLTAHPEFRFVHSNEIWIRNGVRVNPKNKFRKDGPDLLHRSMDFCVISPSTTLMRRDLFLEHGGFNEDFVVCEDFDLWLKVLTSEDVGFVPDDLIRKYGGHEDQLSTKYVAMDDWRIKSLINLMQAPRTSSLHKEMIREILKRKAEILIKGHEKHGQLEKVEELKNLLQNL